MKRELKSFFRRAQFGRQSAGAAAGGPMLYPFGYPSFLHEFAPVRPTRGLDLVR